MLPVILFLSFKMILVPFLRFVGGKFSGEEIR
jgi:hypothetical protein